VRRYRAVQTDLGSAIEVVKGKEATRELERTLAVRRRTLDPERRCGSHLQKERGCWNRGPDAPEPAPQVAAQIEHAEMQARRRFDEHRWRRRTHRAAGCEGGAVRTCCVSNAIAARSRGPAVLSTSV